MSEIDTVGTELPTTNENAKSDAIPPAIPKTQPVQPQKLSREDEFKVLFFQKANKDLQNAFTNEMQSKAFTSGMMQVLRSVPALMDCTPTSLIQAFMECAVLKIYPSNTAGEIYILPYGKDAKAQLGYKGILKLLYRGGVQHISSEIVFKNDHFKQSLGTENKLEHAPSDGERGEAIGVYAIIKRDGQVFFKYMPKADVLKIKDLSRAGSSSMSPWNSKTDPEKWMWKKTCLKQVAKLLPWEVEILEKLEEDSKNEAIETTAVDISAFSAI